jgi:Bacterial Ig-like domain (group 1)/Beta-propeller repeat
MYAKLSPGGTALEYATYLGGSEHSFARKVATDPSGNAYVLGDTSSADFRTTANAYDTSFNAFTDIFVMKFAYRPGLPASLTLAPASGTNEVHSAHCVTATVADSGGAPTPGVQVRFSVSGSVTATESLETGADGVARFCYTGPELAGSDSISAFADTNRDGARADEEPGDTASKTWVLPSSTPDCMVGGSGHIRAANGDRAHFSGSVTSDSEGHVRGKPFYADHGPAERFRLGHAEVGVLVCDGRTATIFGTARGLSFRIEAVDESDPQRDTYRILLSNGYDSGTQRVRPGDVRVRAR